MNRFGTKIIMLQFISLVCYNESPKLNYMTFFLNNVFCLIINNLEITKTGL